MDYVELETLESFKTFISKDTLTVITFDVGPTFLQHLFRKNLDSWAPELAGKVTFGNVNAISRLYYELRTTTEYTHEGQATFIFFKNGKMLEKLVPETSSMFYWAIQNHIKQTKN